MKYFEVTIIYSNPDKRAEIYVEAEDDGEAATKAKKIALEQFPELRACRFENWLTMPIHSQGENRVLR